MIRVEETLALWPSVECPHSLWPEVSAQVRPCFRTHGAAFECVLVKIGDCVRLAARRMPGMSAGVYRQSAVERAESRTDPEI